MRTASLTLRFRSDASTTPATPGRWKKRRGMGGKSNGMFVGARVLKSVENVQYVQYQAEIEGKKIRGE